MSVTTNVSEELFFDPGNVWRSRGLDHVSNGKGLLGPASQLQDVTLLRIYVCTSMEQTLRSDGIALRNGDPCFSERSAACSIPTQRSWDLDDGSPSREFQQTRDYVPIAPS